MGAPSRAIPLEVAVALFDDDRPFIGLDDDAVDGGGECLDAYVDGVLRHNVRRLIQDGSRVVWAPYTYETGDPTDDLQIRPYASIQESSILCVPWLCSPGLTRIEISGNACVSTKSGGVSPGVYGRVWLVGLGDSTGGLPATHNGTTHLFQQVDWQLDLDAPVQSEVLTDLVVAQRGEPDGSYSSASGRFTITDSGLTSEETKFKLWDFSETISGTSGNPNANDAGVQFFKSTQSDSVFDHQQIIDDDEMRLILDGAASAGGGEGMIVYWMSYVQVKSLEVREVFDADAIVPIPSVYEAEKVVRSQDEVRLAIHTRHAWARPRCLWIGPQGRPYERTTGIEGEIQAPLRYAERFVRPRDPDGEGVVAFQTMIVPSLQDPKIELLLNFIPYHWTTTYRHDDGLEALRDAASSQVWEMAVDVETWNGSAWVSVGTSSITQDFLHYPTDPTGKWPVLQAEFARERFGAYVGATWVRAPYVLKEGQLYDRDLALIQRGRIAVPITLDADHHQMVRLTLTMTRTGAPDVGDGENGLTLDPNDPNLSVNARLVPMIVGATIWERDNA